MSFSGNVKEELAKNISSARHCCIAELAAFVGMCGTVVINRFDMCSIKIHTENLLVARKVFTLIEKTFNIKTDISVRRNIAKKTHCGFFRRQNIWTTIRVMRKSFTP